MNRRIAAILGTLVLASGLALIAIPAEAASGSCVPVGSNGTLCLNIDPAGYNASYTKTGGSTATVDFNLRCTSPSTRTFGDNGAFSISAGHTRTYTFAIGTSWRNCTLILTDVNTGGKWYTGVVTW